MAKIGAHLKLSADPAHRPALTKLFRDILEAKQATPAPHIDSFVFDETSSVGVIYGKQDECLEESDQIKGPWVEFLVSDVAASTKKLAAMGVTPMEYFDKANTYFRVPGGPVFRLAQG